MNPLQKWEKTHWCVLVSLLAVALFSPVFFTSVLHGDPDPQILTPFFKPIPNGFGKALEPNVLLLLDTSGSMTFNLRDDNSTYGDGTKPYGSGSSRQWYFGRDTNSNNNDPTIPYNYHPNLTYIDSADLPTNTSYFASSGGRYLYPNDSRLYALKLVLWELFSDPQLTNNLRVALATYGQRFVDNVPADWYKWTPQGSGTNQRIRWHYLDSWGNPMKRAILREPFETTASADHLANLMQWFDGIENSQNQELRAQGSTPLAASIYGSGSENAKAYFQATGVVNGWCQDNWVIILTDGAETEGGNPIQSVKNLYNSLNSKIFFGKPAQPVKAFVIGLIDPSTNPDLANTLNRMADVGWDGTEGQASTQKAYFATDVASLLEAFRLIFQQIQALAGTSGAPMVSPPKQGESGGVYVTRFTPRAQLQWQGRLEKYVLSGDILATTPAWDAATVLNKKAYTDRKIYTIDWKGTQGTVLSGSNLALFNEANATHLREEATNNIASVSPVQFSKFVRWILGSDEWDEVPTQSERWKLGDIFHGGLTEVGSPVGSNPHSEYRVFAQNNRNRAKVLYTQGNDGMLHAFDVGSGEERWAFIPPQVLGYGRLLGQKGRFTKSGNSFSFAYFDSVRTTPRYLLDGPVVAEDVYTPLPGSTDPPSWRTILVGLDGFAGQGLYALDITSPEIPRFLWAVENITYDPVNETVSDKGKVSSPQIRFWTGPSSGTVSEAIAAHDNQDRSPLDYRKLRFTLSVPALGMMNITMNNTTTTYWVALMGNGSNRNLESTNEGCIYVINLQNGQLCRPPISTPNMKNIVTPVTVLRTNNLQRIEEFYAGEDNGWIYQFKESGGWAPNQIMNMKGSSGSSYRMDVGRVNRQTWLFIATGDLDPLVKSSSNNYLLAVNTAYAPYNNMSALTLLSASDTTSVSTNQKGWYVQLENNEMATTPPKLYNGYLYFATFKESNDPCAVGTTRFYAMKADSGKGGWSGDHKFVDLPGIKVSGISVHGGRLYAGVTNFSGGTPTLPAALTNASLQGNLLVFDASAGSGVTVDPIPEGQMVPLYWRDWQP